jgi:hypothetical protein
LFSSTFSSAKKPGFLSSKFWMRPFTDS